MMRTSVIRELGGYDPEFNGLEDYELWCRVLENHKITTLPDVLLRYRIHGSQVTQNPSARYVELLRTLKTRQLRQLGLEPNEEFFSYCQGSKLDCAEKVKALDAFFALVEKANAEKKIYDGEKLNTSFRSVILGAAAALPKRKQKELANKCHYINKRDLLVRQLKQSAKKMLGRS